MQFASIQSRSEALSSTVTEQKEEILYAEDDAGAGSKYCYGSDEEKNNFDDTSTNDLVRNFPSSLLLYVLDLRTSIVLVSFVHKVSMRYLERDYQMIVISMSVTRIWSMILWMRCVVHIQQRMT